MNTRIRYTKTQTKNVFKSTNVYHHPNNGGRYRINIDLNAGHWSIVDDASNMSVTEGKVTHVSDVRFVGHQLKLKARKALESLGIPLEVEARERIIKTNLV